jgi:hypothetical protein
MQTWLWQPLWWDLAESAFGGSLESGCRFCVVAFGRNLALLAVKMFSHLIVQKTQKTATFVPPAVRTSNPTYLERNVVNVVLSMRFAKIKMQ